MTEPMRSSRHPVTLTECLAASTAKYRILLVTPSPLNDPNRLDPRHELEEIYRALDELRVDADIFTLNPPTVSALKVALAKGFDIVHIAMHATGEHLEFEAENGLTVRLPYGRFARLFERCANLLLILNGCATEELADSIARLSPEVTALSMAGDIPRREARAILAEIYRMLFSGATPTQAANEASTEISGLSPETGPALRVRGKAAEKSIFQDKAGIATPIYFRCSPRNSFPAVMNRFFDREQEAIKLYDALFGEHSHSPFVAITGVTGFGKTALAQTVASRYGWRFPDGVGYFRPGTEPTCEGVAAALGWELRQAPEMVLTSQISRRLSQSRCLLVLDNLESASPDALEKLRSLLGAWDTTVGGRAILISQEHHREFDEMIGPNRINIGSLPMSASCDLVTSLLGGSERAREVVGDEITLAADLCFRHPRTLITASSALGIGQPWSTLKEDLQRNRLLGLVEANSEVLGQIISKLEGKIPLITDFLNAWSVFEDRCRERIWRGLVAQAVGTMEPKHAIYSEVLNELQGAAIIERFDLEGEVRCVMHPIIISHLRQRHDRISHEKTRSLVRAHLEIQRTMCSDREDYPGEELRNIRRTLQLALDRQMWLEIVSYCMAIVGDTGRPLIRRGPWQVAKELLDLGESAAAMLPDSASDRLRFLMMRGLIKYRLAEFDQAVSDYEMAHEIAQALGREHDQVTALRGKGQVLYRCGDLNGSEAAYRAGRELAETGRLETSQDVADIDHQLGKVLYRRGDLPGARRLFESVRVIRETKGERRNLAKTIHELARIEHADGNMVDAQALYSQALVIERAANDPVMEQATLFQIAKLTLEQQDIATAERFFDDSRQISEGLNDLVWIAHAKYGKAMLAAARDIHDDAEEHASDALDLARQLNIGLAQEIIDWAARAKISLQSKSNQR